MVFITFGLFDFAFQGTIGFLQHFHVFKGNDIFIQNVGDEGDEGKKIPYI